MASTSLSALPQPPLPLIPYSMIEFNFEDCSPMAPGPPPDGASAGAVFGAAQQGRINGNTLVIVKSIFKTDRHTIDMEILLPLFQAEQEKLKLVRHDRLAAFFGFTPHDIISSLQEYPSMGSLEAYILLNPSLVWSTRHQIALDIAVGMEYLHQRRHMTSSGEKTEILHMDLRSENIMLTFDVEEVKVRAKISNIGFSALVDTSLKASGVREAEINELKHSDEDRLAYLPPEVEQQQKWSKRSDIYFFGIILLELATLESPAVAKNVFWPEILDMGLPSSYSHCMGACLENDYHRRPHFDHIIHNFTKYGDRICWFSDKLFKHKISTTDFVSALKHLESEGSEKIDVTPTPPSRHDYSDFDLLPASPGNSGYNINEGNFESPSKRDRFAKIAEMRSYVSQKSYNGKSSFSSPTASQSGGGGGAGLSMSKRSIGSASNSMRDIHAHEKSSSNGNIMKSSSSRSLRGAAEVSGGGERVTKASGGAGSSDKKKQVQKRSKKAKCTLL